jgi:hypothetical protein
MRGFAAMALVLAFAASAFAVSGNEVMYVGGSAPALTPGAIGAFETGSPKELVFVCEGKRLSVAYDKIKKVEYRKEVAHHLGIAPAIAVGLVKKREQKHSITLTYADQASDRQAAVFEVPKNASQPLLAILAARAPQACVISREYQTCPVIKGPTNEAVR